MTKKITDIMNQESFQKTSVKEKKITHGQTISNSNKKIFIEAIDNLFLKLELSYHYQFYKVYGTDHRLNEAKKIWAESLKKYPAECIDSATKIVIETNEYLPTLTEVLKACSESMGSINVPSVDEAFIEAQRSSSPRLDYSWSHPIVYWAGRKVGWELINSSSNQNIFQVFKEIYTRLAKEVKAGKVFELNINENSEVLEPLDIKLFDNLRKKHNL